MEVEFTDHLGYEHGHAPPGGAGNRAQPRDSEDAGDRARAGPAQAAGTEASVDELSGRITT